MLKRLIEVALPLKEVSEQSAREKSIRHGHISTLHIWWARRPLAACRAAVFASLIPDPDDADCPEEFRSLVRETLGKSQFKPTNGDGTSIEDTPRNRCLEFIKHLVRWENSNNAEYITPARRLITAAHKFLHPDATNDAPTVLDPFAGGGAIPLEALRLGCEAHAVDLNPVAHLIELCTLVYPQKFGQPESRPVPDYISRLIAHNWKTRRAKSGKDLFDEDDVDVVIETDDGDIFPDVEISEEEYRKNPLAADVKYWGHWVLAKAKQSIGHLYPPGPNGEVRLAYLWSNTLPCPNPACNITVPLMTQRWLAKSPKRRVALGFEPEGKGIAISIQHGTRIEGDPSDGTIQRGAMRCPKCLQGMYDKNEIKKAVQKGIGLQPLCVISTANQGGRQYDKFTTVDEDAYSAAVKMHDDILRTSGERLCPFPDELVGTDYEWALTVSLFGLTHWSHQFNARQLVALATFAQSVREVLGGQHNEYSVAVRALLTMAHGRLADKCAIHCIWNAVGEKLEHVFGRQALSMSWDYGELNPFSGKMGDWKAHLDWVLRNIESCAEIPSEGLVRRGSATRLPESEGTLNSVITDPPYYDSVPYADLSDFFYVWHKRCLKDDLPELYRTPVTPKSEELVQQSSRYTPEHKRKKTKEVFESGMRSAFGEIRRVLDEQGIAGVMFAHKSTTAWETLIGGLQANNLQVTSTWPIHTEMKARLRAKQSAALASSILMVCRKRLTATGPGIWDDVREELRNVAQERLDYFWNQGIRGADFFISAIGPALSVYGKYDQVTKLSGEEVTVRQFLDEVRGLVTSYALEKILKTTHTANIDPESRFYVVWKWSYGDTKVPADESFKMAQALGINTEEMWDRTGVLHKSGENVNAVPVAQRMKIKNLGEPSANGATASIVDVLHRLCAYRHKNDSEGMAQFLGNSGHADNPTLWLVAQAVSESLVDGDNEKQLMQGLLNQREGLEEATRQRELF